LAWSATSRGPVGIGKLPVLGAICLKRRFTGTPITGAPPREADLGHLDRLEHSFGTNTFRGCPFVNAVAEFGDRTQEAHKIAIAFKDQRRQGFADLLKQLGVAEHEMLVPTRGDGGRRDCRRARTWRPNGRTHHAGSRTCVARCRGK